MPAVFTLTIKKLDWINLEPALDSWFPVYQFTPLSDNGERQLSIFCDDNEITQTEDILHMLLSQKGISTNIQKVNLPDKDWLQHVHDLTPALHMGSFWVAGYHVTDSPPEGAIELRLDASAAFGTGHHATTAGCLRALEALPSFSSETKILDMGCGSAILSLAAQRLGAGHIWGVDIDERAASIARDNVKRHEAEENITIYTADGVNADVQDNAPYDIVIANILVEPLINMASGLAKVLSPKGTMILSGLLQKQEQQIQEAYEAQGLEIVNCYPEAEWQTLVLKQNNT